MIFDSASDLLFFVGCVLRKWGNNKCGDNERWYTSQPRTFEFITYANGSVVNKVIGDTSLPKHERQNGWFKSILENAKCYKC